MFRGPVAPYLRGRSASAFTRAISLRSRGRRGEPIAAAIDVLRINARLYPKSPNAFDSLGEAYMTAGSKELAIENYEKVLQLDPGSKSAAEALRKLKEK